MNQMTVQAAWALDGDEHTLIETMGLGCETDAYDPMEKAMLTYCDSHGILKEHLFGGELIGEYAFTNELKMMGHVWRRNGGIVIAAKGSPERILTICNLSDQDRERAEHKIIELSKEGLRVIAWAQRRRYPRRRFRPPHRLSPGSRGLIGLADHPAKASNPISRCVAGPGSAW